MKFAVLATGPSMSQEVADYVRGKCQVVAVSDSYKLAPWCDALVSTDPDWWAQNPEALELSCRKFGLIPDFRKIEGVEQFVQLPYGVNSGLRALHVAAMLGATEIALCGVDLKGTHFFGPHEKLSNTTPDRFKLFRQQFMRYKPKAKVWNCSPASTLSCFPFRKLEDVIC